VPVALAFYRLLPRALDLYPYRHRIRTSEPELHSRRGLHNQPEPHSRTSEPELRSRIWELPHRIRCRKPSHRNLYRNPYRNRCHNHCGSICCR
jgi:hypothetical protein